MPSRSDRQRAARLYKAFREEAVERVRKVRIRVPKAVAVMGTTQFIGYMTTHRGQTHLYIHEFAPGSAPLLCAGPHRGQLYMLLGRFKVTGRGITDLSASGAVVNARPKYVVTRKAAGR